MWEIIIESEKYFEIIYYISETNKKTNLNWLLNSHNQGENDHISISLKIIWYDYSYDDRCVGLEN